MCACGQIALGERLIEIGFRLAKGQLQLGPPRIASGKDLLKLSVDPRNRRRAAAAAENRQGDGRANNEVVRFEIEVVAAVSIEQTRVLNLCRYGRQKETIL